MYPFGTQMVLEKDNICVEGVMLADSCEIVAFIFARERPVWTWRVRKGDVV